MDNIKRFFTTSYFSFKGTYDFLQLKTYILVKIINPIFQILFFSLLAKYANNTSDISPWIIGNSFLLCMYNAFFGVGRTLVSEKYFGTLKLIIASPCNKLIALLSKTFFHILDGFITILIGIITGILFLHLEIPINSFGILLFLIFTAMFSTCALGILIGTLGLVIRDINLLLNLLSMIIMAFCGINYPIEKLPKFIQNISYILPLTRSLKGARLAMLGNFNTAFYLGLYEILLGMIFMIVALIIINIMEKLAIKSATIDIY